MSKLMVFHGSDHKCGTTQIAQCTAESLAADFPASKILLVFADGGRGSEYCEGVRESVERIRPYLKEDLLNPDEILGKSLYRDNLYIIGGNDDPLNAESFSPDMSMMLMRVLRDYFDVCIIDSGANAISSGLSLGSLFSSDRIYMLLSQKESSLRNFEWNRYMYEKLKITPDVFIINDYDKSNPYSRKYISDRLNICLDELFTVAHHSRGFECEMNRKSLISERPGKAFMRDIKNLAKDVAEYADLQS